MDLVSRVQGILLKPKDEWLKIKDEPATIQQLFTKYAVILADRSCLYRRAGKGYQSWRSHCGQRYLQGYWWT